jgi:hypothetical protein
MTESEIELIKEAISVLKSIDNNLKRLCEIQEVQE